MSFMLELPQLPIGNEAQQIGAIYSYLFGMASQLNYALGFLALPGSAPDSGGQVGGDEGRVATINEHSTHAQTATARAVYEYAVPQTRKINEHDLTEDVTITADELGAVPNTRRINDKALTEDITLTAADLGAVPTTRQVNGKALSEDVTLTAADLGEQDYVTETGSNNNGWKWRKWHSGDVEMWCAKKSVTLGTFSSWGSTGLTRAMGAIDLPFTLADSSYTACVSPSEGNGTLAMVLFVEHTTTQIKITFARPSSVATVYADVYIRGKLTGG